MLVPIVAPGSPAGVQQWAMVELQGEVERKDGGTLEQAFDVGTLSVSNSGGSVLLSIGYHQLEGKKLPLKKPLAVLEREPAATQGLTYKVLGVVRDKYMFKARPRALITKPEGKKGTT
ncbi:hypothetical protein N2152v2_006079 [Parachlorella kessleri]